MHISTFAKDTTSETGILDKAVAMYPSNIEHGSRNLLRTLRAVGITGT